MTNIFLEYSIPELLEKIEHGELNHVELADTVVKAIDKHESNTHAWACLDIDYLKTEADQAYKRFKLRGNMLKLEGIPFAVKDIFNTKFFPTQMGSSLWKGFTPGNNARVVDSLLFHGGIVAGKTVTAEFAVHALNETLNPHDETKTPGTSSSGSAAAVATGMVPFSLATQTAGSIIRPASFCGVWGMKPSFGMIPRTGVLKTTDSLDTVGFIAAHGKSLRKILDYSRVSGPDYPYVYKNVDSRGNYPKQTDRPWRIGFIKTHVWEGAEEYTRQAVLDLVKRISGEKNFDVEEIIWPDDLCEAHKVHSTIYSKSLSYYFKNEAKVSTEISPIMNKMIADGESISLDNLQHALRQQDMLSEKLDEMLSSYDMVLSLGTSSSAPVRGEHELPDPSLIWTLGHIPSVTVPSSRCPDGMPFGVQFISRRWNDYLLLQGIEELINRGVIPSGSQEINPS